MPLKYGSGFLDEAAFTVVCVLLTSVMSFPCDQDTCVGARPVRYGVDDAVFDIVSRGGDNTVPGSRLPTVSACALCVKDDDDGVNDNGFVDTLSGGVSIDGVIVVCNNDVFVNDNDCSDSWPHEFDCGCADNDDDDENVPPSTPTLDVGNDDSEYNDVTSATPTF
jgi:hypothetical protein